MQVARAPAHRAIALVNFDIGGRLDFDDDGPAMTTTGMAQRADSVLGMTADVTLIRMRL
jgi:hypothetical protein